MLNYTHAFLNTPVADVLLPLDGLCDLAMMLAQYEVRNAIKLKQYAVKSVQ
jgi:hypothetical protein